MLMSSGRTPTIACSPISPDRLSICPGGTARCQAGRSSVYRSPVVPAWVTTELALQEVHRRRANEAGNKQVRRCRVELARGPDLLQPTMAQYRDPMCHRHRLDLIVGDKDRRRVEPGL